MQSSYLQSKRNKSENENKAVFLKIFKMLN